MLDPWIIEEIRRREEEQRQREEQRRPQLEIPLEGPSEHDRGGRGEGGRPGHDRGDRGVVIIDFSV